MQLNGEEISTMVYYLLALKLMTAFLPLTEPQERGEMHYFCRKYPETLMTTLCIGTGIYRVRPQGNHEQLLDYL